MARDPHLDHLKSVLVAGVIWAHATMAWTGVGNWVFREPPVREPLLSVMVLASVIGALFGMSLFFFVAGRHTPASLSRKGPARFLGDRALRLLAPMAFFVVALSPLIEYVDPDNAGWDRGFGAFALEIWWPPAPGPTWFLGVLMVFSIGYAGVRAWRPRPAAAGESGPTSPRAVALLSAGLAVAVASYLVRLRVPLGVEVWRMGLAQAPAWVGGFVLGVAGAERGWARPVDPALARRAARVAWIALAGCVVLFGGASVAGADIDAFGGGATWASALTCGLEGALVVCLPLWLVDLFRRRFPGASALARWAGRAAFAAFLVHQLVLVGLVLGSRLVTWPPEVEYLLVAALGVALSFGVGGLLLRLPGVARVV